jgi:thermostable 8-oxoguanine DNA glycosylase
MNKIIKLDSIQDLSTEIEKAENSYDYQEDLTKELDNITDDLNELDILKIVLWKLNRYVLVNEQLRAAINGLRKNYSINKATIVLETLLDCKGVNLPMASSILRFAAPNHFQIIDQRAYRILTGKPLQLSKSKSERISLYFDYIRLLHEKCEQYNIPFHKADRILYELDKKANADLRLAGYGGN